MSYFFVATILCIPNTLQLKDVNFHKQRSRTKTMDLQVFWNDKCIIAQLFSVHKKRGEEQERKEGHKNIEL